MPSRYHITKDGSVHPGPASDCPKCRKIKKRERKKKRPIKRPKRTTEVRVCKVEGCENILGPGNVSGYCRTCFLKSPAWKNAQHNSLVRVKSD